MEEFEAYKVKSKKDLHAMWELSEKQEKEIQALKLKYEPDVQPQLALTDSQTNMYYNVQGSHDFD